MLRVQSHRTCVCFFDSLHRHRFTNANLTQCLSSFHSYFTTVATVDDALQYVISRLSLCLQRRRSNKSLSSTTGLHTPTWLSSTFFQRVVPNHVFIPFSGPGCSSGRRSCGLCAPASCSETACEGRHGHNDDHQRPRSSMVRGRCGSLHQPPSIILGVASIHTLSDRRLFRMGRLYVCQMLDIVFADKIQIVYS